MAAITDGPLTSLTFCWQLERADGAGLALTSSDRDVEQSTACLIALRPASRRRRSAAASASNRIPARSQAR